MPTRPIDAVFHLKTDAPFAARGPGAEQTMAFGLLRLVPRSASLCRALPLLPPGSRISACEAHMPSDGEVVGARRVDIEIWIPTCLHRPFVDICSDVLKAMRLSPRSMPSCALPPSHEIDTLGLGLTAMIALHEQHYRDSLARAATHLDKMAISMAIPPIKINDDESHPRHL